MMERIEKQPVDLNGKAILVTGAAGFIGSNLCKRLLRETTESVIVGIDCMTDYNPIELKEWRLKDIQDTFEQDGMDRKNQWIFIKGDIADQALINKLFNQYAFAVVVNLAAQAGVRYSITNPEAYLHSNLIGFFNILEACRNDKNLEHLVYASSSSVYGGNTKVPFSTDDKVDNPVSLYAATKKSNELMAHAYSKLYNIPSTGLRFFTVYGPWGRPDMAPMLFSKAILAGKPIKVFNNGNLSRDFTYIDDIIEGVVRVIDGIPQINDGETISPKVYNIGCGHPMSLMDFIHTLEEHLGMKAQMYMLPMQKGDVYTTYANTTRLEHDFGYKPQISLEEGIKKFVGWYLSNQITDNNGRI